MRSSRRVHITTLCHSDDCCPQVFLLPEEPDESCVAIHDDFGNVAYFSPDALPPASCQVLEGHVIFSDRFGGEVAMSPEQYWLMFNTDFLITLEDLAKSRGMDMTELCARQLHAELEALAHTQGILVDDALLRFSGALEALT